MENTPIISNHNELLIELNLLNDERKEKKMALDSSIKDFLYSLEKSTNLKNIICQIAKDNQITRNLFKIGLDITTNFLIKKYFPEKRNKNNILHKIPLLNLIGSTK